MALENAIQAPDFDLPNQFGERVRLSDFRGVKPVALVFFPLAFSSTCTKELCTLRDNLAMFQDHRVELLVVSVDSKATLRAFAEEKGYDFTLLADFWPHGEVSKEYGVFLENKGFATRTTFLIDVDGVIREHFGTEPGQERSLADYRAALDLLVPVTA
ncbi:MULTISPECIES: peroxiredoxin [unclassified Frigoribacterium]|jgi:peroxiredoxin|uniref:peroxiredoxin n=1 Tax=unclassified Frigoribacterium TaxID=2627005 RepID=UPI0005B926D0|nr:MULTISPECIES: peroxiredoxin [unclassified Frigoribacterium]KIU04230.1 peroxiredoxin [Frigoribacterium sp. MEB024]KPG81557.1 peroxiredoxin [Frigoribacterium sp. RIT-PI-h]KQN45794.1 peroxiredoxin [Frigoribacterium sp. Leaf44]KQO46929.1 peroxiredoxin [Frigoribacterium sp. Leaf254]KQT39022.1 peroxiredoxin [Frigoribacterium sp. Leaf415]